MGTGKVLVIWSVVIVAIGVGLFIYGIVVVLRDRRRNRRARAARQVVRAQRAGTTAPARRRACRALPWRHGSRPHARRR